jgi:hypothetical protein
MKIAKVLFCFFLMMILPGSLLSHSHAENRQPRTERPGQPRPLTRLEHLRIEGYMNYLSNSLYRYFIIYGEYPVTFNQLLDSGLIAYWPLNPLTNEPVRIISRIRESDYEYAGEISYEYNSPKSGQFRGIFETSRSDGWIMFEFPDVIDQSKYKQLVKKNPGSYTEEEPYRSAKSIVSIFGTLKEIHLDEEYGALPASIEELFGDHFRIIREYYHPAYTGDEIDEGGFFELGVELNRGFWYSIYKTRPDYTYRFAHKFPWKGLKLDDKEFVDDRFPALPGKFPIFSGKLYEKTDDLPQKLLISRDDIKYVRSK